MIVCYDEAGKLKLSPHQKLVKGLLSGGIEPSAGSQLEMDSKMIFFGV